MNIYDFYVKTTGIHHMIGTINSGIAAHDIKVSQISRAVDSIYNTWNDIEDYFLNDCDEIPKHLNDSFIDVMEQLDKINPEECSRTNDLFLEACRKIFIDNI